MIRKTDCQLFDHDAQRCIAQNLVGLTEEDETEHVQAFTNTGLYKKLRDTQSTVPMKQERPIQYPIQIQKKDWLLRHIF